MTPSSDPLAAAIWTCGSTSPGLVAEPGGLDAASIDWLAIDVPGTAAAALLAAGLWSWGSDDEAALDGSDWWFRCRFEAQPADGPWELELAGLATLADVWLNGAHVLRSENMFLAHRLAVTELRAQNELVVRCASLDVALAARHPRPRWKSRLVRSQSLRWQRTSLLGRMPGPAPWAAPIGPWRAVTLSPRRDTVAVTEHSLAVSCDDAGGGSVTARLSLTSDTPLTSATLHVGDASGPLAPLAGEPTTLEGTVQLASIERWWPHTHGPQPLYPVTLEVGGERIGLGNVGFRTIEADTADGGFGLLVNGARVFCRGVCWGSPDPVSLAPARDAVRASLERARDAGMNMLRVPGYTTYEGADFWDACDELGLLVWQDCMLASTDPPEAPEFAAALGEELLQVFGALAARPSLAVACGGSETYQQAAMFGLEPSGWDSPLLEHTIPALLDRVIPGIPYVPSSPSGGFPPFTPGIGVAHYFGVGAYLRTLSDARLANVRFASECLAFGTPPEPETIDEAFGGAAGIAQNPRWKLGVARDAGSSWDFEDVTNHYLGELFAVDPVTVRYADPERALDLGRAAVCELMSAAMSEWRRTASSCDGAIILQWQDWWPGAGWGIVDALGRPKAPLYALRRVLAPTAVVLTDEGLAGLAVHVLNDGPDAFAGLLRLRVFNAAGQDIEAGERELEIEAHGSAELNAEELLGGFRDLTRAYRFGPPAHDVVVADLVDADQQAISRAVYLPSGPARPRLPDLGLRASATPVADGEWTLTIDTRLFAHYVAIDAPGFAPSDSWFHLPPGASKVIALRGADPERRPIGSLRALNGPSVFIAIEDGQ